MSVNLTLTAKPRDEAEKKLLPKKATYFRFDLFQTPSKLTWMALGAKDKNGTFKIYRDWLFDNHMACSCGNVDNCVLSCHFRALMNFIEAHPNAEFGAI